MRLKERSDGFTWIPAGDLARAFGTGSNNLPPTADLTGRNLSLHFENGRIIQYEFETANRLLWRTVSGYERSRSAKEKYVATKVREGIYFLDFVKHLERATSVTLVLDLRAGIFVAVLGRLPTRFEASRSMLSRVAAGRELTGVSVVFLSGSIDKSFNSTKTPRLTTTNELLGRRVEYSYSPTERYEHVYLNEDFYTWHCLAGAEKGLADTDRCQYYKLSDRLYLFVWREKVIPTLGVVVVDFGRMGTCGKILGYQNNDFQTLCNFQIGAKARIVY